jgi:BR serine/threonine kinase
MVALAQHSTTGEHVAIKVVQKSAFEKDPGLETKIKREIALMHVVHHPNILRLIDVLESSRSLYIILEYAERGELFDFLVSRQNFPVELAIEIFRQLILAVEYLHFHGICHRDLKPENILLDSCDRIKIADFGFARWVRAGVTATSCGSPHYAAPEVIRGILYDGRLADIWSLGVILFALVCVSFRILLLTHRDIFLLMIHPFELFCAASRRASIIFQRRFPLISPI